MAVGGAVDVELHAVGPELDRPRERRNGVLGRLPVGAAVGEHEGHRARSYGHASICRQSREIPGQALAQVTGGVNSLVVRPEAPRGLARATRPDTSATVDRRDSGGTDLGPHARLGCRPRGATRSACRDSDPDVFFPIGSTGPALEQIETARRICTACTVSDECLEFALATNQEAGIWGGTTEEERRKLRKAWLAKQRMVAS